MYNLLNHELILTLLMFLFFSCVVFKFTQDLNITKSNMTVIQQNIPGKL